MARTKFQVGDLVRINTNYPYYWRVHMKVARITDYQNRKYSIFANATNTTLTITAQQADLAENNKEVHEFEQWEASQLSETNRESVGATSL